MCRWVLQDYSNGADDENDFYANTPDVAARCCQFAVCSGEEKNLAKGMRTQNYHMKNLKMQEDEERVIIVIDADSEDENFMNVQPEMNRKMLDECEKDDNMYVDVEKRSLSGSISPL